MHNKFDATLYGVKLCIDIGLLHPAASRQYSVIRSPVLRSARNTPSLLTSFVRRAGFPSHMPPPRVAALRALTLTPGLRVAALHLPGVIDIVALRATDALSSYSLLSIHYSLFDVLPFPVLR